MSGNDAYLALDWNQFSIHRARVPMRWSTVLNRLSMQVGVIHIIFDVNLTYSYPKDSVLANMLLMHLRKCIKHAFHVCISSKTDPHN